MSFRSFFIGVWLTGVQVVCLSAQSPADTGLLSIDRIFNSAEFLLQQAPEIQWLQQGNAYILRTPNASIPGREDLIRVDAATQKRSVFLPATKLIPADDKMPIDIESFTLSADESRALIFTNSSRVWRSNTKGDFWVADLSTGRLSRLGASFPESSLMFAKLSNDNRYAAYVHDFNLYIENLSTGETTQLTSDGNGGIINGTFDWVYEEEFGCRDGFRCNASGSCIAFWQLDASDTRNFYMINNTDSVYSRVIPIQYPMVGQPPSACRVGIVQTGDHKVVWIPIPGNPKENYIPRMQWVSDNELLIQQLNRLQNHLTLYVYTVSTGALRTIYEETEKTWVDISYPDVTADGWEMEDLLTADHGKAVLRMTETDGWRHLIRISLATGEKVLLTPGTYDVARTYAVNDKVVYFSASPRNTTERYLYSVSLSGKGDTLRITPGPLAGMNNYNVSPGGKYALHEHSSITDVPVTSLVALPSHRVIGVLADNAAYKKKAEKLKWPETGFFTVTTHDGVNVTGSITRPLYFDPQKKYPVLFHVYGEPWEQVALNQWPNLWHIFLAQQGYVVIAMDNRGSPCLNGAAWRKSIYKQVGRINSHDQAMAARKVLEWDFIDSSRVAVWGWSGGGSMTLNLLFRYPGIYKTGMAVAPLSDLHLYDNVYTERYMGLPSDNTRDYYEGSPVNFARNLKGNLLIVHGSGDDNVHYQNTERVVNELIRYNKPFTMMEYPNRSHSIYEGANTQRHLYSLLTRYLKQNCPPGGTRKIKD